MLEYQTPSAGSHYGPSIHRSDGATENTGGSPASQYGYSRYTSFDDSHDFSFMVTLIVADELHGGAAVPAEEVVVAGAVVVVWAAPATAAISTLWKEIVLSMSVVASQLVPTWLHQLLS